MLYLILNEHQVTGFDLSINGKVQQGMKYESTHYGLAYAAEYHALSLACDLAQQLAESDCSVVLTVGKSHKVWVALNAAEYPYYQALESATTPSDSRNSRSTSRWLCSRTPSNSAQPFSKATAKSNHVTGWLQCSTRFPFSSSM